MFVHNCEPDTAPNPTCCSDPRVLCQKCAAKVLANQHHVTNVPRAAATTGNAKKPVPLGIPVMNFRQKPKPEAKLVTNSAKKGLGLPRLF